MSLTANEEAALEDLIWELSGPHTQAAIAKRLGVSQVRVHHIERQALRKLRSLLADDWGDEISPASEYYAPDVIKAR